MKVMPESFDDLWHLYNIIYKNDQVYALTSRSIKLDQEYSRPKKGERISALLGITVLSLSWNKFQGKLRVHGVICSAPDMIPTGVHHTLNISPNQPITIVKKEWPKHNIDRLKQASKTQKPMLIIGIDDEGFAIAETRQYGVEIKVEERIKLPGKLEAEKRSGAMKEYFKLALSSLKQLWSQIQNPIMILGVGFVKNDFARYLTGESKELSSSVKDVKSVNNCGVAGIYEALRSGVLATAAKQIRIVEETRIMEEVMKRLGKGDLTITYGFENVEMSAKMGAAEILVLADTMLRETSDERRRQIEKVMSEVELKRGEVHIVSTEHEAGSNLLALGGIAAILRYKIDY